ncbi:MAG: NAD-dependent epimerase/dehydratase family protein [Opitutales bacterium]
MPTVSSPAQRLLVTGGRGRLASLIADHFRAPAHQVTLFSRGSGPGFQALSQIAEPATLAGAAAILHLAWSSLPSSAEQHPDSARKHDLPLLAGLLRALTSLPAGQRPLLVFFSSGGAIYGNAPGRPSIETDTCRPIGRYGEAKLAAENLIDRACEQAGLACTILRISNPYGFPVPSGRAQGIIPHAIRCAATGQPLTLWGDGHARKDFLYYTDFLSGLDEVLNRKLTGTFNLCAGESHTVSEVIAMTEQHTSRKIAVRLSPAPPWDVQDSRLDNRRFQAATEWCPQVSLDEGIRRSAAGYFES